MSGGGWHPASDAAFEFARRRKAREATILRLLQRTRALLARAARMDRDLQPDHLALENEINRELLKLDLTQEAEDATP